MPPACVDLSQINILTPPLTPALTPTLIPAPHRVCSLEYNDFDSATKEAIRAAWGDRDAAKLSL